MFSELSEVGVESELPCAAVPVVVVFTAEFSEQAEVPFEVPVAFQVGLILSVLAADDPGFGFYAAQKAELVVLMQYTQVGAGAAS